MFDYVISQTLKIEANMSTVICDLVQSIYKSNVLHYSHLSAY